MKLKLICVGKLKEAYLVAGVNEYVKRLAPFAKVEILEVADERIKDPCSKGEAERILRAEGARIGKHLSPGDYVIPLCVEGTPLSSEQLASTILGAMNAGKSTISFIIGGSLGLSSEIKARGDLNLSVSRMTFPHQLMRLMLAEQAYRAYKIIHGHTYHK